MAADDSRRDPALPASPPPARRYPTPLAFPRLRLRTAADELFDLPWEVPLADWPDEEHRFRALPVGPSRHLVRFLDVNGVTFALKEEPLGVARREFEVLRHLEEEGMPAVSAVGLAEAPESDTGILITQYLAHSLQYRRL